jgi:hypothetical protein
MKLVSSNTTHKQNIKVPKVKVFDTQRRTKIKSKANPCQYTFLYQNIFQLPQIGSSKTINQPCTLPSSSGEFIAGYSLKKQNL